MNAGIDPFTDDDPMNTYQNILKGKVRFPRSLDQEAKGLIKHLLVADVSRRYGNMKYGAEDIKHHKWFANVDWKALISKKCSVFYKPTIRNPGDTSNFNNYPDSDT